MTGPTELDPNDLDPTGELAAALEAQRVEYGTYVASVRIYAPSGALAYEVGHPVPISNVVKHGYWHNDQVVLADGVDHAPEIAATLEPEPATPARGPARPAAPADAATPTDEGQ